MEIIFQGYNYKTDLLAPQKVRVWRHTKVFGKLNQLSRFYFCFHGGDGGVAHSNSNDGRGGAWTSKSLEMGTFLSNGISRAECWSNLFSWPSISFQYCCVARRKIRQLQLSFLAICIPLIPSFVPFVVLLLFSTTTAFSFFFGLSSVFSASEDTLFPAFTRRWTYPFFSFAAGAFLLCFSGKGKCIMLTFFCLLEIELLPH